MRSYILAFGLLIGLPSHADPATLPLIVEEQAMGGKRVSVEVLFGPSQRRFYLDTAAGTTRVRRDSVTEALKPLGQIDSQGAYGASAQCTLVTIPRMGVTGAYRENFAVKRCDEAQPDINNLGLDFFAGQRFELKTRANPRLVLQPPGAGNKPLYRHKYEIAIPLQFGSNQTYALFDTGAGFTIIDSKFVAAHPEQFEATDQHLNLMDINGNRRQATVVKINTIYLGDQKIEGALAAVDDMSFLQSIIGETITVILGNNIIFTADWSFDLERATWDVKVHEP